MTAIKLASRAGVFAGSSRTDGLRAVRLFETVNGVEFDPGSTIHRVMISNTGWHFALQRRLRMVTALNRR